MWNVPVRFLVMWSPIVAVSIGGGIYIYECTQTLLAPGTGFTIDYPTKNGSLKITCKTYNIDLLQQTVIIDQLVIRKKDGSLLARVPHFVATGISAIQGLTPKIQLKDAEVWVNRDAKGDLDILNMFESSQGTASQQPWQVSVKDSVIHFADQTVTNGAKNDIKIDSGNFVGMGENAEGGATLEIPGLAKGQIGFIKLSQSTSIYGKNITGKLEPVLARLRSGNEKTYVKSIDTLKIGGGTASGDFTMTLSNAPVQFLANFTALGTKVAWDTYTADLLDISGTASEAGFIGKAKFQDRQTKGEIEGNLSYAKETVFGGILSVSGVTPGYLESLKVKLPKDIDFTTAYSKGQLSFEKGRFGWNGKSSFESAKVYGLKVPHLDGDVSFQGDFVHASIKPTAVGETMVEGNFGVNLKSKEIYGSFSTPQLSAKDLSRWLPANVLQSKARLVGLIDGTLSRPNILVKGSLEPKIKLADRTLAYNPANVVLRFDGSSFNLDRLELTDDSGSLYASGTIDLKKGLNVRVVANNFDLTKLASTTSGKVDLQGQISGTIKEPRYGGKLQAYQFGYSGISGKVVAIASDFSGDVRGINFKEIDAMKGASQISGSLGIGFADQKLSGLFAVDGIDVSDIYEGELGGILDLKDISVSGTFSKPLVSGSFDAKKVLAFDFAADSAHGKISYDGERFRIFNADAVVAKGSFSDVSGVLDAKSKTGNLAGKFQKIDLSDIHQTFKLKAKNSKDEDMLQMLGQLAVRGSTSGTFDFGFSDGKIANLTGTGRVDDVFLNKATIGSGDWDVAYNGKDWSGNAFIGSLAEYFRLDGFSFSPTTQEIGGEFLSYKIPLRELILGAQPRLNWSDDLMEKLGIINGQLSTFAKFSGSSKSPSIDVPDFEISAIKLGKEGEGKVEDIGTFSMKATYANNNLSIVDGLLLGPKVSKITLPFAGTVNLPSNLAIPNGTAKLSGTIKDMTELNYDLAGSVYGFPISKFAPLVPALLDVDVFVDRADLKLTGNIKEPLLASQIKVSAGLTPEGKKVKSGVLASRLKVEGEISAKPAKKLGEGGASQVIGRGSFKFGPVEGAIDLSFLTNGSLTNIDKNAPFSLVSKLDGERDVTEFFSQADGIILGEKGARLSGGFEVGNTFEDMKFKGGLDLKVDSLRSVTKQPMFGRPVDTVLKDLVLSASLENDPTAGNVVRTRVTSATNYSKQDSKDPEFGFVRFDAKIPVNDLRKFNGEIGGWINADILDGSLAFKNLGLYQSFAQSTFAQATIFTELGKPIKVAGTLSKPKLSGSVFFDDVKTIIPTLLPTSGAPTESIIDPAFDLKFFVNNPMNIKSSLASVDVIGTGSVAGTFSNPKVNGQFTVEKGDLLLPGGKVKLTPDGTVTLKYDGSVLDSQAQLIANLLGETSSTILKNGVTPERQEVVLKISGDLLSSESQLLNVPLSDRSNQPLRITAKDQSGRDLSNDEIYRILGRTDILQSFLQAGVNSSVENDVKNAGLGLALPSLLNGLTNEIARSFHLDYVGVDYNAFEQTSISFVKTLGNSLFFQGRQQLLQPLPGKPTAYDFRLVYRPRQGPNAIRALSFSIGTDHLRPYKLSIDFSYRIRTRKAPYQTLKLDVPNK